MPLADMSDDHPLPPRFMTCGFVGLSFWFLIATFTHPTSIHENFSHRKATGVFNNFYYSETLFTDWYHLLTTRNPVQRPYLANN